MTIRVRETCMWCGAEFEVEDTQGTFVNPGGKPDWNGDVYRWEKTLREWRKAHDNTPGHIKSVTR